MKLSNRVSGIIPAMFLFCALSYGKTVRGEIVRQQVDGTGNGYSLIKVWGTYKEMGHAHGTLLAEAINVELASLKKLLAFGTLPSRLKWKAAFSHPMPRKK